MCSVVTVYESNPAPRWPPMAAVRLTVCEEVDAVFASDPGQRVQVALTWKS